MEDADADSDADANVDVGVDVDIDEGTTLLQNDAAVLRLPLLILGLKGLL